MISGTPVVADPFVHKHPMCWKVYNEQSIPVFITYLVCLQPVRQIEATRDTSVWCGAVKLIDQVPNSAHAHSL